MEFILIMDKYTSNTLYQLYRQGAQTRSDIMKALKMRQNSLVEVCDHLEESGLVLRQEPGRRRNVLLDLNPRKFGIVGIDHQIDEVHLVLLDGLGRKKQYRRDALNEVNGKRLKRLIELTNQFLHEYPEQQVIGLGMADVGIIDPEHGLGVYSAHISEWHDLPLEEKFREKFRLPLTLIDRVDACCFADLKGKPVEDRLQIWCGNGIGMSTLRKGEFIGRGVPFSGQLGHTIVERGGKLCRCGNRGCLETVAAANAVIKKVSELSGLQNMTLERIIDKAHNGNRLCATILREAGEFLGVALANTVVLTGIANIAIQGPMCRNNPFFCEGVERELRTNILYPLNRHIKLEISDPPQDNIAMGAALFARSSYFESLNHHT